MEEAVVRRAEGRDDFRAWAKRTGKSGERLRARVSCAYRKMRQQVPHALRQALVDVYRGGDLDYAKRESKKSK